MLKKIILILVVLFVLIIAAIVAIPIIYKDDIKDLVIVEINKQVDAEVGLGDIDLSLLSAFPNLSISLTDLSVIGKSPFAGDTLLSIGEFAATVDVMSVINGEAIGIRKILLDKAVINAIVLEDSTSNWDIAPPSDDSTATEEVAQEGEGFQLKLNSLEIQDARISFSDATSDMMATLDDMDYTLTGDFTEDQFDLNMNLNIADLDYSSGAISYAKNLKLAFEAEMAANTSEGTYTFQDNKISLNEFELAFEGMLQMLDDELGMDVKFGSPQTEFKHLLSLVPGAFTADFANVQTAGSLGFNGYAKQTLGLDAMAFGIDLKVKDAMFAYPDLPSKVENINIDLKINNPDGEPDNTIIDMSSCHLEVAGAPFDMKLLLKTPVSDPDLEASMNGKLDLAVMNTAFPIEGVSEMSGIINTDLELKGQLSSIEEERYDDFKASGGIQVQQLKYKSDDLPQGFILKTMSMKFSPQNITLSGFDAVIGTSDLQMDAEFNGLLGYVIREDVLQGNVKMRSTSFNTNEWLEGEAAEESEVQTSQETSAGTSNEEMFVIPKNLDISVEVNMARIDYEAITLNDVTSNMYLKDGFLKGSMSLSSDYIDVDPFMEDEGVAEEEGSAETEEALEVFYVPGNMDFTISCNVGKVHYDNMDLTNVAGVLTIANETIRFDKLMMQLLGGSMVMDGSYSTANSQPKFTFSYDIRSFDVQQSFSTFNTIEKMAPIAKFIQGNFNSTMKLSGDLDQEMMPIYDKMSGGGKVVIPDGKLENFKGLTKLADKLKIPKFPTEYELKQFHTAFEIKNGRVEVEPFDYKIQDMNMNVSGSHGFDESLAYTIRMDIPRDKFGSDANAAVEGLLGALGENTGVNVNLGSTIKFPVAVGGTMDDPTFTIGKMSTDGDSKASLQDQAKDKAKEEIDKAKDKAKAEVDRNKKELEAKAAAEKEKARAAVEKKKKEEEARAKAAADKKKEEVRKKAEAEQKKLEEEAKKKLNKLWKK